MTACEALGHILDLWMQDFRTDTLTAADLPCARCGRTLHILIRADVFDTPAERGREAVRRMTTKKETAE